MLANYISANPETVETLHLFVISFQSNVVTTLFFLVWSGLDTKASVQVRKRSYLA